MKMIGKMIWDGMYNVGYMLMAMLVGYMLDILLLFGLAFCVYKLRWNDATIGICVNGIYILGGAIAGLIVSKHRLLRAYVLEHQNMMVPVGLATGIVYVIILIVIAILITENDMFVKTQWLAVTLLALCGGLIGTQAGYRM